MKVAFFGELRALAQAATPGPWTVQVDGGTDSWTGQDWSTVDVNFTGNPAGLQMGEDENAENDARFIAQARTDVPTLLAHVDALQERYDLYEDKVHALLRLCAQARRISDSLSLSVYVTDVEKALGIVPAETPTPHYLG